MAPEIVACESEASLERVESKSDSEEDMCFGVVWEKMPEPVQTMKETEKSDGVGKPKVSCPFDGLIVPETELQNSPVKVRVEGTETEMTVTEATATETTVTETTVTETTVTEAAMTETVIQPVKVAKHFEAGLFIGEITAVSIKRGRNLYTVLYEDGDGEDMNDREYKEARALYEQKAVSSLHLTKSMKKTGEKKNATKCALRKKRRKNENGGTM